MRTTHAKGSRKTHSTRRRVSVATAQPLPLACLLLPAPSARRLCHSRATMVEVLVAQQVLQQGQAQACR